MNSGSTGRWTRFVVPVRSLAVTIVATLAASCGREPVSPLGPRVAASFDLVSGNDQQGVVGQELPNPLVVRVLDATGHPIPGEVVNFRVVSGGGSVFAGAALTNVNGIAQERWTLGITAADSQRVEVRSVDPNTGEKKTWAVFRATAIPTDPSQIFKVGADPSGIAAGAIVTPVPQVRVLDRYGNPVPGASVAFMVTGGGGSVSPSTAITDASGVATASGWRLGSTVGVNTLSATFTGATNGPVVFTTTSIAATAAAIQKAGGDQQTGAVGTTVSTPLAVRVVDAAGNPVGNVTVNWAVTQGGGSVNSAIPSDGNGIARVNFVYPTTAGTSTIVASLPGTSSTVSFTETTVGGAPAGLVFRTSPSTTGRSGVPLATQPVVQLIDAYGNPSPTAGMTVIVSTGFASPATVYGNTATTQSDGSATFTSLAVSALAGTSSRGLIFHVYNTSFPDLTASLTLTAGNAAQFVYPGGPTSYHQTAYAGAPAPVSPLVRVLDGAGNPVAGVTVNFAVTSGGGSVANGTTTTRADGYADVTWTLGPTIGISQTVTATTPAIPSAQPLVFYANSVRPVANFTTGGQHTCATTNDGSIFCWGAYGSGGSYAPTRISGAPVFIALSGGELFTCGLTSAGVAYCWGYSNGVVGTATPMAIPGLVFRQIDAGYRHVCGVTTDGDAYCWGNNGAGQLGDGSFTARTTPVRVSASTTFQSISAGYDHTCAVATSGQAYCWGSNTSGQLGGGDVSSGVATPRAVSGGITFAGITAGMAHSCGVATNSDVYCWGGNSYGELTGTPSSNLTTNPFLVQSGYTSVVTWSQHTCGVKTSGATYCWGRNDSGQIGAGFKSTSLPPTAVQTTQPFASVQVGLNHSCGLTSAGALLCWGGAGTGELGLQIPGSLVPVVPGW